VAVPTSQVDWSDVPPPPERFHGVLPRRRHKMWTPSFAVVAHAFGAHSHINSIEDIRRAFSYRGVNGVDVDVRISHNGVPVLYHDPVMLRDFNPWPVEFFDDDALARMGVDMLGAVYEVVPRGKFLALDIKTGYGWAGSPRRTMLAVAEMLETHPERRAKTRVWLHRSEDVEEFRMIMGAQMRAHPGWVDVQAGMSTSVESPQELRQVIDEGYEHHAESVSAPFAAIDSATIAYAHEKGIFVYCWRVDADQYEHAIACGVDCVNADDITRATTLMARASEQYEHRSLVLA